MTNIIILLRPPPPLFHQNQHPPGLTIRRLRPTPEQPRLIQPRKLEEGGGLALVLSRDNRRRRRARPHLLSVTAHPEQSRHVGRAPAKDGLEGVDGIAVDGVEAAEVVRAAADAAVGGLLQGGEIVFLDLELRMTSNERGGEFSLDLTRSCFHPSFVRFG